MRDDSVSLEDKYARTDGRIFLTGVQALVRLLLVQARRDRSQGLCTRGFVSGYRGSPLGGLDQQLWRARAHLEAAGVRFQPGLNEDLAATAIAGTQQLEALPGATCDGVFGLWYGKAPGLDRSGDALRHGNAAGSAAHGGVLVVAGDDHACKSSTLPSQSEPAFVDLGMPVLNPAGVQEVLDYGLLGWALSRFAGCWVGLVALADTMDSSATVDADANRVRIVRPAEFEAPPGGLHFRVGRGPLEQEALVLRHRLDAALAFARANGLDRTVIDSPRARLGIVTTGKAHLDALQALDDLGIDGDGASALGLRVYKVGLSWPLEPTGLRRFAEGLDEILVVEEKRGLVEGQIKELLYDAGRPGPRVLGKRDEGGRELLPAGADLSPGLVARALAGRLPEAGRGGRVRARLAELEAGERIAAASERVKPRTPFFCAGCPHNTSTRLPAESHAIAGIGCHYMVRWMERRTDVVAQMGGEGMHWVGQAPFTETRHVFVNIGDGTYQHSGILALRAALAARVNVTFKILFNDAVAMTGGQKVDGRLTVAQITRQLAAEGVERIAVVNDLGAPLEGCAPGTSFHRRGQLDALQRQLRATPGCSALVFDQTCAAEMRRRRKRGLAPDPERRVFIHEEICEGCGDCTEQSSCIAIEPVETEFGRKRQIDQSSCNKDYTCLEGLCPAMVSVRGGRLRRARVDASEQGAALRALPLPDPAALERPWNVVVAGIGGTGVVTIGALLGMAAHLEGRRATVLDMTGLAQKGGAVLSHVRLAANPEALHAPRVSTGSADLLLACDLVVAASRDAAVKLGAGRTHCIVDTHLVPTAEFVLDNDVQYEPAEFLSLLHETSRELDAFDATQLATRLLGDGIATNLFLLGYAFQKGLVPLGLEALERAIELNGVAVEANLRSFGWGRLAAADRPRVEALAQPAAPGPEEALSSSLAERVERRARHLVAYQGEDLSLRYRERVEAVREAEQRAAPGHSELTEAVARSYHRLLALKDEYEVARLYTDAGFRRRLEARFEGDFRTEIHLAPPLFARRDPDSGRPRKRRYGPWIFPLLRLLARARRLRGSWLDVFGHSAERCLERALLREYESALDTLVENLHAENHAIAVRIAALPQVVRGFGEVKLRNAEPARREARELLDRFLKRGRV
jgi:indolepyruvate ferredoxin oxidoreductase